MSDYPTPKPPLPVRITTGPHGHKTVIEVDGLKIQNATSFVLAADCKSATTLTISFINVAVEVEGLVETTSFNAETKTYKRVLLKTEGDVEQADSDDDAFYKRRTEDEG